MNATIAAQRLVAHRLTGRPLRSPADVVTWFGAVQAQEYEPACWGLAQRMDARTRSQAIAQAFDRGRLLRTHVMRPTWHFVTPADIRWMLALTAPRVHRTLATYRRQMELDARTLARGTRVLERALRDGQHLTRTELRDRLDRARIAMSGVRLAHLTVYAELEGVICSGPRRGKHFTYALLEERAPDARPMDRDAALAELARRYLRSHGPATRRDFMWWSGLTAADAVRGIDACGARQEQVGGRTYWRMESPGAPIRGRSTFLLPIYDEYIVAYRDRDAVPHGPSQLARASGTAVIFQHALVIDGQVAGTWRLARNGDALTLAVTALRTLTRAERDAVADAATEYGRFRGVPVTTRLN